MNVPYCNAGKWCYSSQGVKGSVTLTVEGTMAGQGSSGNVIAALASFFIPGLGQLLQGRIVMAAVMFVLASVLWIILLGWLVHLWSIVDAALYKPRG